jgi:YqjK-like protein
MDNRMYALMQRRGELLARIESQREQVSVIGAHLQTPLALVDQGMAAVKFLRSRPLLVAGMAALMVLRRRGVVGLAKSAWRVWKGYRQLSALSEKLSASSQ